jgi:hypothetical protein
MLFYHMIWRSPDKAVFMPTLMGFQQGRKPPPLPKPPPHPNEVTEATNRMNLFLPSHQIPLGLQRTPSL